MMSLMSGGADDEAMSAKDQAIVASVTESSVAACRREGLSQAQADCILTANTRDQFMALGDCPALQARKPRWLIVPPTAKRRAELEHKTRPPDGPHTGPVRYRQLTGSGGATCGLREDGTIQCWGSPTPVPSGMFVKIGWRWHLCGLTDKGKLVCASDTRGDDLSYLPNEPLSDFAEGPFHGCGVRAGDGGLTCWTREGWKASDGTREPVVPPAGKFAQVVSGFGYSCARTNDGHVACFGPEASPAPSERFRMLSGGLQSACGIRSDETLACWGANEGAPPDGAFKTVSCGNDHCCAIRADDTVACWGSQEDGRSSPPDGKFSAIVAAVEHSCGVRTDGTICWGKNHLGQTNVPQHDGP